MRELDEVDRVHPGELGSHGVQDPQAHPLGPGDDAIRAPAAVPHTRGVSIRTNLRGLPAPPQIWPRGSQELAPE